MWRQKEKKVFLLRSSAPLVGQLARLQMVGVRCVFLLVFVCWTLAGSSGLWYWPPGDQLTSLTGPDPGSPSASLSADDRRIVGIQPQGAPSHPPAD